MTEYTHKTYATGEIITTINGLRDFFPEHAHLILDDMTQDDIDTLDLPWDDCKYTKALKKSAKALKRSIQKVDRLQSAEPAPFKRVPTPKPNNIKPLVAAIAYHSRFH